MTHEELLAKVRLLNPAFEGHPPPSLQSVLAGIAEACEREVAAVDARLRCLEQDQHVAVSTRGDVAARLAACLARTDPYALSRQTQEALAKEADWLVSVGFDVTVLAK